MDFYLTAPDGGRFHFPINPENVTNQNQAQMQSFEVINLGKIEFPKGRDPLSFEWEGILPGESRKNQVFVKDWAPPLELLKQLEAWHDAGTKLRLLVTETSINYEVYIVSFQPTWSGGHGDITYSIQLTEARAFEIMTEDEWRARQGLPVQQKMQAATPARPAPSPPKTYTVKSGDTLYGISKRILGNGNRWREIYNANAGVIGKNPNLIYPGQVYRLP